MSGIDTSSLLALRRTVLDQNKALRAAVDLSAPVANKTAPPPPSFGAAMQSAVAGVNESQAKASALTDAYETGKTSDVVAVMLAKQKASLEFEATLQVRNKLLAAYKDIMSMPV